MSTEDRNKQIATEFLTALAAGNMDTVAEMTTDDFTWWIAGSTLFSGTHQKAAWLEQFDVFAGTFAGPNRLTPTAFTAEGERVAVECEGEVELKNGRTYANLYHILFEIRDGKIASGREYMDTAHVVEAFAA
jgi:ketosteroid isomerase-like protein